MNKIINQFGEDISPNMISFEKWLSIYGLSEVTATQINKAFAVVDGGTIEKFMPGAYVLKDHLGNLHGFHKEHFEKLWRRPKYGEPSDQTQVQCETD